jgi:hypothetical protein
MSRSSQSRAVSAAWWADRRRLLVVGGGLVGLVLAILVGLLGAAPAFYRERLVVADGRDDQQSRRLITKVSAVHAGMQRPGRWEAAITEPEINAWLATDLPANHAALLPAGWSAPRVELLPERCRAGVRLSLGPVSTVAWIDARVQLRESNQLFITVEQARLGALPMPAGPILRSLARQITRSGMHPQFRRLDGRSVLVVYTFPPATNGAGANRWLEAVALGPGELLIAGETRAAGGRAGRR